MDSYDVLVIGGGPAGYVAAIRAAQLGFKTACVDAFERNGKASLGGTCLNVGCIPSKALLDSSEKFEMIAREAGEHGIQVDGATVDLGKMLGRKESVVDKLTGGVAYLFKKNKVTSIHGLGRLVRQDGEAWIVDAAGKEVRAKNVIVATGSSPRALPGVPFGGNIVDNSGALAFEQVPAQLGVIGAGVIGVELGSVWRRLGAQVTILEALPGFLLAADEAVSKEALKQLQKQGLDFHFGIKITEVQQDESGVTVTYEEKGQPVTTRFDKLIVSIGRVPHTAGLGAQEVGLQLDERGFVKVDDHFRTNLPGIYAIGDVIGGPMLAHKAEEEGVAVAELLAGQAGHVNYAVVPWVIYTSPEIAWAGLTEKQAREQGHKVKTGQFPFSANGRALGHGDPRGFVKVVADADTDKILGVHMVGPNVSELIGETVALMEFGASAEDLGRTVHAHPTLSEVVKEAALATDKRALHM
ncbi:dihydrolipoyl dehydrogenase [Deinococcus metallilatus]|uniref:Dihydrolipoyl dehydrogenase n=1 Tax=Deinococcus metallilatus TaxID=1211322 RepID=A0AAJ5F2E1_9DEIO|nr:dihydrolipoyl dehydrogenase [Deinococcus metallilatus]MBB5297029.1 dihydrolipoamide dehydrogenase [Deinococcus metallilatus]QBY07842.1 dihydrolipoyl dehydrogenase [Deinococcus metallilatus]RXJ13191.1 dihydrolipoyl dehydrogenase [Deinococcus metallilatus]TLK23036.1 dihydrolipoyl dehydrogenase [Deinococcus metallilatus]GMA15995.1 dihydrolipoyl dehydrogenase [Deinococcus metallilatus]